VFVVNTMPHARAAFLDWLAVGKPKFGYYFELMRETRATFELSVRYCKNHGDQLKGDAHAEALSIGAKINDLG